MLRLIVGPSVIILLAGSAVAGLLRHSPAELPSPPAPAPAAAPTKRSPEGRPIHGGPIERLHDPADCDLIDVARLPGNWTHGDYVSWVAGLGDPTLVPIAARSDCGKPIVSFEGGPPGHAVGEVGPPPHARGKAKGRSRSSIGG